MIKIICRKNLVFFSIGVVIIFSGCAKEQLLLNTYSPPMKQAQVKEMIEKTEASKDNGYISLEVFDDISTIVAKNDDNNRDVASGLISNIKKFIGQTNFISLNEVADASSVALDMKINKLDYEETENSISAFIEVVFNIRKSSQVLYTQVYEFKTQRQSRSGRQGLPSKGEILSEASEYLAMKLIKDISPIKTRKLVELQELPKELKYTVQYAKGGNFKGAIKAMESYQGEKGLAYYFNLGVYYEAIASINEDLALFAKADENYEKAMASGGNEDQVVVGGKTKFDNFYEIIKKVAEQKMANKKQNSKSQFELLD